MFEGGDKGSEMRSGTVLGSGKEIFWRLPDGSTVMSHGKG